MAAKKIANPTAKTEIRADYEKMTDYERTLIDCVNAIKYAEVAYATRSTMVEELKSFFSPEVADAFNIVKVDNIYCILPPHASKQAQNEFKQETA